MAETIGGLPTVQHPFWTSQRGRKITFPSLDFKADSQGVTNGIEYTQACL